MNKGAAFYCNYKIWLWTFGYIFHMIENDRSTQVLNGIRANTREMTVNFYFNKETKHGKTE